MARRYSTLSDIIEQLKLNNDTSIDTTHAVDSLTNVLSKQFVKQNKDALEASRERKSPKVTAAAAKTRGGSGGMTFGANAGFMGGVGMLAGGLGYFIKGAGVGIGAAAAGLGAFFAMLAVADKNLPNGGENVKKLLTNTAGGLAAFATRDLKAFGLLLAGGALFGAVPGLSGIGAGIGIGAVGVGLAAFFTGLGSGDMALGAMESTAANLKVFLTNLGEGLSALTTENFIALGGLMAAGGALGMLFGVGKTGKAVVGLAAIGVGIAAFLTPLAGLDSLSGVIGSNGSNLGGLLKNIAEGLSAFDAQGLAAMTGLFAAGAIFGAVPGGALIGGKVAVGLGLVGVGLGAFLGGLAGVGKLADYMGVDGSGIGKIMKNIAGGMNELGNLPDNIGAKVAALAGIGPGLALFFGGSGIGQLTDAIVNTAKKASNFLFGTDFENQADSRKTMIKQLVDSIAPLKELDISSIDNLEKLSKALNTFSASIANLGNINLKKFQTSIKRMIGSMKLQLDLINAMANGGVVGSGYFDGIPEANFKKGFLDPNLKIDQLQEKMGMISGILDKTNVNTKQTPEVNTRGYLDKTNVKPAPKINTRGSGEYLDKRNGNVSIGGSSVDNSSSTSNTSVSNTSVSSRGGILDLQDQFGFGLSQT